MKNVNLDPTLHYVYKLDWRYMTNLSMKQVIKLADENTGEHLHPLGQKEFLKQVTKTLP